MSKTPKTPPDTKEDGKVEAPWESEVESESGTSQSAQCAGVGGKLEYVQGDLFSCPATHSLAHCISEDCRMGAGIAVLFKKKFNGVQELLAQEKKTGECAVLKRFDRFIYYLITKKKYNHKPTYETLRRSLEAMRAHCLANNVTRISMPRIGCGLDRLSWTRVSVMIEEIFLHTNVAITVYII